ncbi:hypothetical protein NBRC116589_41970 [Ruegeria sp. HU-ET01832]
MRAAAAAFEGCTGCLLWAANDGDPNTLDLNGFRDGQSILQFNTRVPNGAVPLGVTEKKLNGSKVTSLLVYLGDLGSAHRIGAMGTRLEPTRSQVFRADHEFIFHPFLNRHTCAFRNREVHRFLRFAL